MLKNGGIAVKGEKDGVKMNDVSTKKKNQKQVVIAAKRTTK